MKKLILATAIAITFISCGGNTTDANDSSTNSSGMDTGYSSATDTMTNVPNPGVGSGGEKTEP